MPPPRLCNPSAQTALLAATALGQAQVLTFGAPLSGTAEVAVSPGTFTCFPNANGGTASGAEAGLFAAMQSGKAYVNIQTTAFPGGVLGAFAVARRFRSKKA